jgi:hypothetical protein
MTNVNIDNLPMPEIIEWCGELVFPAMDGDQNLRVIAYYKRLVAEEQTVIVNGRDTGFTQEEYDELKRDTAQMHADMAAAEAAAPNQDIYRVSKSGKRMSIQIGSSWYEDHDVKVHTPLKVLTDLIPQGNDGHVRHYDAMNVMRRLMKHPGFGATTKISLLLPVNMGAMREFTTFLLTKKQYLWVASALSDEYLALAIKAQYDNLSESERALDSKQFVAMLSDEAGTFWNDSAKAETPEQTTARLDTMDAIDAELAVWNEIKADFPSESELMDMQIAAIESLTGDPSKMNPLYNVIEDAVLCITGIRDMMNELLTMLPRPLAEADKQAVKVIILVQDVNRSLEFLARIAKTCETYDIAMQCHPHTNSPFVYKKCTVHLNSPVHMKLMYWLKKERILDKLPQDPKGQFIHDEVIEFGIYTTLYGWMGANEQEGEIMFAFKRKHNLTQKQLLRIVGLMENTLGLHKQNMALLIVEKEKRSKTGWVIHSVLR